MASAHIHMTSPRHRTDAPTGDQKEEHCGTPGWVRASHPDRIAYFLPGATVTVTWDETIQHPGYFRISFQPDGEVFRIPLCGGGGAGPDCGLNFPDENLTGQTDPGGSGSLILADQILDGTLSTQVTLPNMECSNCTLQLIQVMTDKPPYTRDALSDDIYFNCADVVLSNSPPPDAGPDGGGGNPAADADPGGGGTTGGCSTGGGSSGILTALSLVCLFRRRTFRRS